MKDAFSAAAASFEIASWARAGVDSAAVAITAATHTTRRRRKVWTDT
jgi:hypothetical protein